MTTIQAGIPINQPGVKPLDMSKLKMFNIAEASEEVYQRYIENSEKVLEARYSQAPDTSNSPAYKPYATVQVNGKTVAEIDNHGFVETSNALSSKLNGKLGEIDQQIGTNGPVLAQATVPVEPDDTIETLATRVQAREKPFLIETLGRLARGELDLPKKA